MEGLIIILLFVAFMFQGRETWSEDEKRKDSDDSEYSRDDDSDDSWVNTDGDLMSGDMGSTDTSGDSFGSY